MKHKRLLLLAVAATLLMTAATATALAATHQPVPPEKYAAPAWVAPDQATAYLEGYRDDYKADLQAQETGSVATPEAGDPGKPMLLFVAPEDRDEAIARVMKGGDLRLVQRPDGLQAIAR
jgi:hypothetical protein